MLIGEYTTRLAVKNRTSIPQKLRNELLKNEKDLIVTRGYEKSLLILNKKMWETVAKDIVNGSFINKNIRETTRFLVGGAMEITPDKLGRILLPSSLIQYAEIKNEIVFIGLVNWVEIWAKEKWQEKLTYLDKNSEKIASELANMTKEIR